MEELPEVTSEKFIDGNKLEYVVLKCLVQTIWISAINITWVLPNDNIAIIVLTKQSIFR